MPSRPIVQSVNGVAHIALAAAINPATNAPGFEYNGGWVAPTIEVDPGDTITIDYTNNLPVSSTPPNMTNLHFHGMTVSPNAPADEVINTMAMPGETLHYSVPIPSDEPSGLYWYHPHPHGESNWQVESGMIGAIIVDGIEEHDAGLQFLTQRGAAARGSARSGGHCHARALAPTHRATRARAGFVLRSLSSRRRASRYGERLGPARRSASTRASSSSSAWSMPRPIDTSTSPCRANKSVSSRSTAIRSIRIRAIRTSRMSRTCLIPPSGRAEFIVTG